MLPERQQQFSPEISWPSGHSGLDYRNGDYRYPAPSGAQPYAAQPYVAQPPAAQAPAGEHPYAAFGGSGYGAEAGGYAQPDISGFGYGDPGYSNPSYDGPASQDLGIAGTRTVSGFVEPNQGANYGAPYGQPAQGPAYMLPPGHPSGAYPAIEGPGAVQPYQPAQQAPDVYQQPWDYEQPLRYDGEEPTYPGTENYAPAGYEAPAGYDAPGYATPGYETPGYEGQGYQSADYNGSDYSMPGVNGMGYDLSGIIHTGEFPEIGYDQPSYDRLSYDDPRYDNGARADNHTRFDMPAVDDSFEAGMPLGAPVMDAPGRGETRFDMPSLDSFDDFDDTRLDHVWPAAEDLAADDPGYGDGGFGLVAPERYGNVDDPRGLVGFSRRLSETRFDMPALPDDEPAGFDETRIDGMRAVAAATEFRPTGPGLLAPADEQSMNWADETSLDSFEGAATRQVAPLAFRSEQYGQQVTDTGSRRAIGKRRGRSGDKRQWMALGAIAVVAAGAIGFVVLKFANSGPGGPAHTVSTPNTAGKFTREPNLEQQMKVSTLASEITKQSSGQASNVVSAVYQEGSSAPGSNPQTFIFVGGKLANGDPSASVTQFDQQYAGSHEVAAGSMGGEAACGQATANGESVAMCVWFDNDTFGDLVSSTMSPSSLASTLASVRPNLEHTVG
jgi:hypothetical protein